MSEWPDELRLVPDADPNAPRPEPSDLVRASPHLMALWTDGRMPPQEIERRARGAQRLKEAFSSIPFHAQKAEKDPDYWHGFYASRVNW